MENEKIKHAYVDRYQRRTDTEIGVIDWLQKIEAINDAASALLTLTLDRGQGAVAEILMDQGYGTEL